MSMTVPAQLIWQLRREPANRLSDVQLLALLCDIEPGPHLVQGLDDLGGMARLRGLNPAEVGQCLDLNHHAALRLAAAFELSRRLEQSEQAPLKEPVTGGDEVYRYLSPRVAGLRVECFFAFYLDAKGGLEREEQISAGTLTASLVHPREVFAPALVHRAAAVVVAHNHPSGDPEPSQEDRATTKRLQRAGKLLGIQLLDHVIIGNGCYVSFLERGWL